jgi:RNA recognition motif-containing protein
MFRGGRVKIYVGSMAVEVTEEDLKGAFQSFGEVTSVVSLTDLYI